MDDEKCPKCGASIHYEDVRHTNGGTVAVPHEGKDVHDIVTCLERQVAQLQAIVDKVDKTADGVPVVSRMPVFSPAWHPTGFVAVRQVRIPLHSIEDFVERPWYSTREAAEAAKEPKK